jgi:protoporphyrinogen/coproporphyrinogen III oxidase
LPTRRDGRKRFIFRGQPRQLPLNVSDLLNLGVRLAASATSLRPRQFETIAEWGRRVLGKGATNYLLVPALGGIYAGDPERLSASLIFGRASLPGHLRTNRPARAKVRGTVAPPRGMQRLIDGLADHLKRAGVEFVFSHRALADANEPTAVCLSARNAAEFLADIAPEVSESLRRIEMLSLVTATSFYSPEAGRLKGFGCLFPRDQGFRARGVLFNDCIFEGRGPAHAETWIFGGALDPDVVNLSDQELAQLIADERERFFGANDPALDVQITRWPKALPHYSVDLERILTTLPPPPPNVVLVGNYLGRIGLGKILERAACVAEEFRRQGSRPTRGPQTGSPAGVGAVREGS